MTITSGDTAWRKAYLVLLTYTLLCSLIVVLAPNGYLPHLTTSRTLSSISDFPSTTAFCIEMMWVVFPLAFLAFSIAAPIKITKPQPGSVFAKLALFFAFGFLVVPLLIKVGLFTSHLSPNLTYKTTRMILFASHSKIGLVLAAAFYFLRLVIDCLVALRCDSKGKRGPQASSMGLTIHSSRTRLVASRLRLPSRAGRLNSGVRARFNDLE